jgi:hypothetical protein
MRISFWACIGHIQNARLTVFIIEPNADVRNACLPKPTSA